MSSAAVQSSGPAISGRQYQQSSQGREQYYNQPTQPNTGASSTSSRRASRRPSDNGAPANTPSSPQHNYSPSGSTSNMTTPRAQPLPPSTYASPAVSPSAMAFIPGPPIAPPPRTSSNNRIPTSPTSGATMQLPLRTAEGRPPSSHNHMQQSMEYAALSEEDRMRADPASAGTGATPRRDHEPAQPGSSRGRQEPPHSRSVNAIGSTPINTDLPREESTVINRIVASDPQEDLAREQARAAEAKANQAAVDVTPRTGLGLVGSEGVDDGGRGAGRSRQDHSRSERSRKEMKFGEYILGHTLGEGEFGKVKMGWKKDSSVEVAIKLIRKDTLGTNNNRRDKINREINILKGLKHPNIVRLHEMVETERHIGIILEYASGGELFDYILNHRYLKDSSARRLFAQLVSGVGYLHKTGIVHRDLKLENLLLDRNRNIIITDFGFANTFNPNDELTEDIEYNLNNKEYVKQMGLDRVGSDGYRRGDLMQTSCGSPCYAAPELVVSDSLYTGRKVDVWSCGVILYAMLAGYLPFDDDPDNPEGDNINLLYKYIVNTQLSFPEYVTPHARDLLKRILVPNPRNRADLFEVARHSWLAEYHHVVGFITSSTTTSTDIANTTVTSHEYEAPPLARSASVREPTKPHSTVSPVGGLTQKHTGIDSAAQSKTQRDTKRRTVQVEYVAPHSQTARGETSPSAPTHASSSKTRARGENQGPVEVSITDGYQSAGSTRQRRPSVTQAHSAPSTRPLPPRSYSISVPHDAAPVHSAARPSTGGTVGGSRLPSRGNSYGQPVMATVATTNAQGRFSQPKGKQYTISAPIPQPERPIGEPSIGSPAAQRMPSNYQSYSPAEPTNQNRGHKRSSTVSETIGRFFIGRPSQDQGQRSQKNYPPTSMTSPISNDPDANHRQSMESSRRTSFGFSRKTADGAGGRTSRRFSLLPSGLSKTFSSGARQEPVPSGSYAADQRRSQPPTARNRANSKAQMAYGRGESRSPSQSTMNSGVPALYESQLENRPQSQHVRNGNGSAPTSAPAQQMHFPPTSAMPSYPPARTEKQPIDFPYPSYPHGPYYQASGSDVSEPPGVPTSRPQYPAGFNSSSEGRGEPRPGVLQKNRKFGEAYEGEPRHHGSSGPAKRVMDIFRRIGKAREREGR